MSSQIQQHAQWQDTFYKGLRALVDTTFPKHCPKCERRFETQADFLLHTIPVKDISLEEKSGLFAFDSDAEATTVGVFRNCECGTTLMADFQDRRDTTTSGQQRRAQFERLLDLLSDHGIEREIARTELLTILNGKHSTLIENILGDVQLP